MTGEHPQRPDPLRGERFRQVARSIRSGIRHPCATSPQGDGVPRWALIVHVRGATDVSYWQVRAALTALRRAGDVYIVGSDRRCQLTEQGRGKIDGREARERIGCDTRPPSVWDTRRDRMAGDPPTIGDLDMPAPKRGDRA